MSRLKPSSPPKKLSFISLAQSLFPPVLLSPPPPTPHKPHRRSVAGRAVTSEEAGRKGRDAKVREKVGG